ncbi:MAG: DoxX family protein [Acidobacteriota bacterium]
MKLPAKYSDTAYALLRIVAAVLYSFHGAQKIFGILGGTRPAAFSQLWFAGLIELAGGLAIAVGFGTRIAAFIASGEMAVAYIQVHWKLQLTGQAFPLVNHGELAVLYCFLFLFVAARGTVKWGLAKK